MRYYPISIEKLQRASIKDIAYFIASMSISSDYEYFDEVKHLLDIPEKQKSYEELEKEYDDKYEKLLVETRRKFQVSKQSAEYHFDKKFKKINENFEYAKRWGSFPFCIVLNTTSDLNNSHVLSYNNSYSKWGTEFRFGNDSVGYYFLEPDVKFYMSNKPNFIVRFFMNKCFGLKWSDGK